MSSTKHTTSQHVEFKRIINLVLLFIIIALIFQNSAYFKTTLQNVLSRFYKNDHPGSASVNRGPLPIFSENLIDFDDVNTVDKTRLSVFLVFCFIITIPFMV
ncbi:uncharacterized protein SKDI_14G1780 [Saccharomyces kudriavzevii IFO 1802]|uniref:YNL146W-like protein n=2 Tax=Saccharomyces kudriavzevii (strain ATCC MYA-4449 / AS 2.2408 / CBS 8840 / NBRC 1802 / NCYC 2889) TaxID=226230 RepID=J5RG74_SACK1|nr:uncharacterized protein SKDI_14G1780 [Saccharomyces kudriavzevii IFO 1802]EJT41466.1 YNL146W-like protein [Saccharomyces kudriavzevii IFO 1802]CAI4049820.1 hypothetical protein SKDI_14G1780 [Saccharomyces kudriavzevii IFO 1802]